MTNPIPALEIGLLDKAVNAAANEPALKEVLLNKTPQQLALLALAVEQQHDQLIADKKLDQSKFDRLIAHITERADVKVEILKQRRILSEHIQKQIKEVTEGHTTESAIPATQTPPVKDAKAAMGSTLLPRTLNVSQWTPEQIATVSTLTIGTIGAVALWQWWKHRKDEKDSSDEKSEKQSWLSKLAWIPIIGLGAYGLYQSSKMMEKFEWYKKSMEDLKGRAEGAEKWVKDHLPGSGEKSKKYGLEQQQITTAENSFRDTRGKDLKKVREIFGLKDGETSKEYEQFIKDMGEKYSVEVQNGITYARLDVATRNYESYLQVGFHELLQWMENHAVEEGAVAYFAYKTGFIDIKGIINSAEAIGVKALKVAAELAKFGIRHPLISLFTVGGSILALKTAESAIKRLYLAENFHELSQAVMTHVPAAIGSIPETLKDAIMKIEEEAKNLTEVGEDYGTWLIDIVGKFGSKIAEAAPDTIGLTQRDTIKLRNGYAFDNLQKWLENRRILARTSTKDTEKGMPQKYVAAVQVLTELRTAFESERANNTTESNVPQQRLESLKTALAAVGVTIEISDGIVRWKAQGRDASDLCVDPSVKNLKTLHDLSNRLREGDEGTMDFMFFRYIQALREQLQKGGERSKWIPGGKVVAMAVGLFVYITDPENDWNYFVAPISLTKELFVDKTSWSEKGADVATAAAGAGMFTLNVAAFAAFKKLIIGGGPIINRSWKGFFQSINPITSPFKTVKDIARGTIDLEVFWKMGRFFGEDGEKGGLFVNTLLGRAKVRPEWIGAIEHSEDIAELKVIGREIGAGHMNALELTEIKDMLRSTVMRKLRNVDMLDLEHMEKLQVVGRERIYERVAEWCLTRSRLSKIAGKVSDIMEAVLDPRTLLFHIRSRIRPGAPKPTVGVAAKPVVSDPNIAGRIKPRTTGGGGQPPLLRQAAGGETIAPHPVPAKKPLPSTSARTQLKLVSTNSQPVEITAPRTALDIPTTELGDTSHVSAALDDATSVASRMKAQEEAVLESFLKHPDIAEGWKAMTTAERNEVTSQLKRLSFEEWEAVRSSDGASKLVRGAILSEHAAEETTRIAKAIKAAKLAAKGALVTIGVAGDAFGCVMAYYDWKANGERIAQTNNPELKKLYENAYTVPYVEGGASAVGLVISGLSFMPGVVGPAMGIAAAGVGAIMLPVTIAILAFRYSHGALIDSAAANLTDVSDYEKMQPEELLQKLIELSETKSEDTVARRLVRTLTSQTKQAEEQTYNEQRSRILEAYLRRTNTALPTKMKAGLNGTLRPETPREYENRRAYYIRSQMLYIARITQNSYQLRNPSLLEEAQNYADLIEYSQQQKTFVCRSANGDVRSIDLTKIGALTDQRELRQLVNAYQNMLDESIFDQIAKSAGGSIEKAQDMISFLLRHHLALFKTKVRMITERDGSYATEDVRKAQRVQEEIMKGIADLAKDAVAPVEADPKKHSYQSRGFYYSLSYLSRTIDGYLEAISLIR